MKGPWLGSKRGYLSDWATQRWVQLTGRRFDSEAMPWLAGPVGRPTGIGSSFYADLAESQGLELEERHGEGLMSTFSALGGPEFDPAIVHPEIVRFYERTSEYRLDAWSEWSGAFRPFGWLLAVIFSRRLQQLNIPLSPLETSRGFRSRIVKLVEPQTGVVLNTGWVREVPTTDNVVYVGDYSTAQVPGSKGPCVKVVFPLPNGSATVLLRPEVLPGGSLKLHSSGKRFGDPGFYFVVSRDSTGWTRYVQTLREVIHIFVNDGELRTDHTFSIWGLTYLRLHYRLQLLPEGRQTVPESSSKRNAKECELAEDGDQLGQFHRG